MINVKSSIGYGYTYSGGGMNFPGGLASPGHNMLTNEAARNRSAQVVENLDTKHLRVLIPVGYELLNHFPPNGIE